MSIVGLTLEGIRSIMKLLYSNGAPKGITFRRHKQNPNSFVIRVNGNGSTTDIGADANHMPECYEKAIDKRLELIGESDNAEAWQTLASAYGAFLTHYGVSVEPVINYEFKIKEK